MAIRRITISVPDRLVRRVKRAAGHERVSTWVTRMIEERLYDSELERQWHAFYVSVAPRRDDVRRADAMFRRLTRRRRPGAA